MNATELAANERCRRVARARPERRSVLPFADASFDAVTCCVSVDYLTRPLEVFAEAARVLRPGGAFVCTFSNRCFPTKAIRGWLSTNDEGHCAIVIAYFELTDGFDEPTVQLRNPGASGDPLYAVWARSSTLEQLVGLIGTDPEHLARPQRQLHGVAAAVVEQPAPDTL